MLALAVDEARRSTVRAALGWSAAAGKARARRRHTV
jgi:hypothetical protein